jgi:hypothetical protein
MEQGVLEQVRIACAMVAAQARYVHIEHDRIASYAASLPLEQVRRPEHDAPTHYLGHGADTVAFFVTLDAINFGSGYFPFLRKRAGMSGYFTVATALKERFEREGPLTADQLSALTLEDCAHIFGQDLASVPMRELMQLFTTSLNELGDYLNEHFGGSFTALVERAEHSVEQLAALLIQMPSFNDVAHYQGRNVPLFKRAQITGADLWIAFGGEGWGRFDDLERLTIYADNLVPHVLHVDGVLRYEPELVERITRGELIEAGSEEEIEMRACAIHTVELLVAALRGHTPPVYAMHLDFLLWNRGQQARYKDVPRHRTRTIFY